MCFHVVTRTLPFLFLVSSVSDSLNSTFYATPRFQISSRLFKHCDLYIYSFICLFNDAFFICGFMASNFGTNNAHCYERDVKNEFYPSFRLCIRISLNTLKKTM